MDDRRHVEHAATKNTTIVERKSDREVVVTRWFDAPARLVFEAWSKPELFMRWWAPKSMGMTLHSCEMDVRTGGRYRLGFGDGMDFFGTYVEVTPPSRIVWTNDEGEENGSITTVTLTEEHGRTLLVMSELFPSENALDADGGGAADAAHETFEQLDELLMELAPASRPTHPTARSGPGGRNSSGSPASRVHTSGATRAPVGTRSTARLRRLSQRVR
jgi:uncharacterized protein YndB with AHSA1/START domain